MERKTIGYHRISHLVERQYQNEEAMRKELERGNYTSEHPYIVVNPYLVNPLTAMILFKTEKEEAVTLTVKGKEAAVLLFWITCACLRASWSCWFMPARIFTEPPALRTWQDRSLSFRMRPIGCGYQFMMASPVCLCLCS